MKQRWIEIAKAELGQKEIEGDKDNPRILQYAALGVKNFSYQSDEIPWCAAFTGWCLKQAGIEPTYKPNARSYLQWGVAIPKFRRGAVAVFKRGSSSWQGHVAFALEEGLFNVKVIGGNQGDAVSIANYSKKNLLGYRWHPQFDVLMKEDNHLELVKS